MYNVIHMYNLLEYSHNYSMTSITCEITLKMKSMKWMIMLQMVNDFGIKKIVGDTPERPPHLEIQEM